MQADEECGTGAMANERRYKLCFDQGGFSSSRMGALVAIVEIWTLRSDPLEGTVQRLLVRSMAENNYAAGINA